MRERRERHRQPSLRRRVTVLGLGVTAAWLVVVTVALNVFVSDRIGSDFDLRLATRAADVAATIRARPDGAVSVVEAVADDALDSGVWIFAGSRVVEHPVGPPAVQRAVARRVGRPRGFSDGPADLRLYTYPVLRGDDRVATVVTVASVASAEHSRTQVLIASIALVLLVLAGAWAVLHLVAGRILEPVTRMTRRAGEWSAHGVAERFGRDQHFRELSELAATLNAVLERQASAVRHERALYAELSHELRTPLTRVLAEVDLLLARPHDLDETRAAHGSVRDAAVAMTAIIDTLMSAERAELDQLSATCRVRAVVDMVVASLDCGDVRTTVEIDPGLTAGVEQTLLERIVSPLVANAVRHAAGTVVVVGDTDDAFVRIQVVDDGPGVRADLAGRIFEPGVTDGSGPGAGLGLPLARRLARVAGGDVTYEGGATFRVRLPGGGGAAGELAD